MRKHASFVGLRSSPYGIRPFPSPERWLRYLSAGTGRFPGANPCLVWIVGVLDGERHCRLNFPLEEEIEWAKAGTEDGNEAMFAACDAAGVAVWIQIEPADISAEGIASLIRQTLARYGHHACVRGFGIDVEWYHQKQSTMDGGEGWGMPVDDATAELWDRVLKAAKPGASLFLKHWESAYLPPTYRSDMIFVNDSQMHASLASMKAEFDAWARHYHPNPVMYQIGYPSDSTLWNAWADPLSGLGQHLMRDVPANQGLGIVWVDFTLDAVMETLGVNCKD